MIENQQLPESVVQPRVHTRREVIMYMLASGVIGGLSGYGLSTLIEGNKNNQDQRNIKAVYFTRSEIIGSKLDLEVTVQRKSSTTPIHEVHVTYKDASGDWRTACVIENPTVSDTYTCEADIGEFVAIGDTVEVSLNVLMGESLISGAGGTQTIIAQ